MGKWVLTAVAIMLAGAAEAAMSDAQCENFLRRMQAGESVYVGPAERECIRRSTLGAAASESVVPTAPGRTAANESHWGVAMQAARPEPEAIRDDVLIDSGPPPEGVYQKVYDVTPFERQVESVLTDLLHDKDAEAVFIDGSGRVIVRDDTVGHDNIEKALAAYRDRYMVSYTITVEKEETGKWAGGSKKMVAAGQISPVTSPQHLSGFTFSLRYEGGQAILEARGPETPQPTSLIFPSQGGVTQYMGKDCVYRVRLTK